MVEACPRKKASPQLDLSVLEGGSRGEGGYWQVRDDIPKGSRLRRVTKITRSITRGERGCRVGDSFTSSDLRFDADFQHPK